MGYTTDFVGRLHCYRPEGKELGAFLKAIREGDHATAIPLADWLQDHNDRRGEEVARLASRLPAALGDFWRLFGLKAEHAAYLLHFSETRRMRRNPQIAQALPDPVRAAVGLPIGPEGAYFVGGEGYSGQAHDDSVLDYNKPPRGQPGLWCQWIPNEDGTAIVWDDGEKFYCYVEWLEYLIEHFLRPWGYLLNGEIKWQGEDEADQGKIVVTDNGVRARRRGRR
jgi:hypothetical protein